MTRLPLTRQQRLILDFITSWIAKYEYAPSQAEIRAAFNLRSSATMHKHLANLEAKGYLARTFNHSRSLTVIPDAPSGPPCPHCGQPMPAEERA